MLTLETTRTLCDGHTIPQLGFGVFKLKEGDECEHAVRTALDLGYRHIDTAAAYHNEASVGKAVKDSGIPRENLFITTKLWIADFGTDSTRKACENSLQNLGMDYVDLYLIHWPFDDTMMAAWSTMQDLRDEGKCRSIGVSNFTVQRFERMFFKHTDEVPAVNQVEWHPFCFDRELLDYCTGKGIALEGWGPLTRGQKLDEPAIVSIARAHDKTPAQILLRWQLQHGVITIPKSAHDSRIRENADLFDVELSDDEMKQLDDLACGLSLISWRPCPPDEWY